MKEKPTVGSQFFGWFPSDRIPKATMDVTVHLFIHRNNSCELYRRLCGTFEATGYEKTYFFVPCFMYFASVLYLALINVRSN